MRVYKVIVDYSGGQTEVTNDTRTVFHGGKTYYCREDPYIERVPGCTQVVADAVDDEGEKYFIEWPEVLEFATDLDLEDSVQWDIFRIYTITGKRVL